ncbi:ankyrin repeat domain-containing protein 34B-like [Megalops cyprinoides]|uniref:ankyrin repeat domain-containing protein 34B-like n=1 Tax=Megalops cyprinoides TaxID=118141 RepID=UPI0018640E14|nr:ankyrin repeat domain-containing protein 34B-like [Megalops cyprinoides]
MEDVSEVRTDSNSLLKAVYLSRLRLTRLLLEGGAYINESNERGETPLMVACKTKHVDQQSVTKAKMVKYLLESGADPNIQDKSGRTALMHACLERAGPEVVSLLLRSGADPSLEDHSGSSALIHAVNASDKETLRVLLDACKARGKEVIIITTDKLPSGRQMTKQYLNVPPSPNLEDRLLSSPMPCTSPSEIELRTSPQATTSQQGRHIFTFKDCQGSGTAASQPGSPTHKPSPVHSGMAKFLHLQRLNSEPWLKIPQSLLAQQTKASSLTEDLPDITPEEELSFGIDGLNFAKAPAASFQNIHSRDTACWSRALEREANNDGRGGGMGGLSRKMSYDDISSLHSSSHPDIHRNVTAVTPLGGRDPDCLPNLAVSSLRNILQRRNVGMEHYSSDSQLSQYSGHGPEDCKGLLEKRKLVSSRSSTLSGSRESLESTAQVARRHPGILERRGSGALLSDHISHSRPGYLPPLNPHVPIPHIAISGTGSIGNVGATSGSAKLVCGAATGLKPLVPTAPTFPKDLKAKKMLLRRHSMQTEQIKQLVNLEEIFSH